MDELKPISHKEFNKFIKCRGFKGKSSNYTLKDLKEKFDFKPLVERRTLEVSLNEMEPTKFDSMWNGCQSYLGYWLLVCEEQWEKLCEEN